MLMFFSCNPMLWTNLGAHVRRWNASYEIVSHVGPYEDPFLWRDDRGFHMLSHDKNQSGA